MTCLTLLPTIVFFSDAMPFLCFVLLICFFCSFHSLSLSNAQSAPSSGKTEERQGDRISHFRAASRSDSASSVSAPSSLTSRRSFYGTATLANVLGLAYEHCTTYNRPPCIAYCSKGNDKCYRAAKSSIGTCGDVWASYYQTQDCSTSGRPPSGWSWTMKTYSHPGEVSTSTRTIYTTFSAPGSKIIVLSYYTVQSASASQAFVRSVPVTMTPVYALGSPVITQKPITLQGSISSWLTGPTPDCRYTEVARASNTEEYSATVSRSCGQCTIHGGNVQLYWWPSVTDNLTINNQTMSREQDRPRTSLLSGKTLQSPSVYLSLHELYAENYCSQVNIPCAVSKLYSNS